MDYARQQRDPAKHMIGIGFVVLFHVLVIYALVTGLARTVVEVIKKPLSATIIEEIKAPPPPPPPPKKIIIEPQKVPVPVQPYIPPPDIPVPTTVEPVISAPVSTPPPAPYVIAPPPPPVVVAPAPPPKPAIRRGITPIKREDPVYPRAAIRLNIEKGKVVARLNIDEKGNVTNVTIISADPPRHFDRAVIDALSEWKFTAEGEKYVGEIEINFSLK
ncbi:MAG: TonB family protein [Betaproteobacteria bacterium]